MEVGIQEKDPSAFDSSKWETIKANLVLVQQALRSLKSKGDGQVSFHHLRTELQIIALRERPTVL
jgi:hypothetical protein